MSKIGSHRCRSFPPAGLAEDLESRDRISKPGSFPPEPNGTGASQRRCSSSMPHSSRGSQPNYGLAPCDGVLGMNPSEQAVDWQEMLGHSGQVAIMRAVFSIDK